MVDNEARLESLRKAFSKHRAASAGRRTLYPQALIDAVKEALASGIAVRDVAIASGTSLSVIHKWRRSATKIAEKNFDMVNFPSSETTTQFAVVHLPSGTRIELPVEALSSDLLRRLGVAA